MTLFEYQKKAQETAIYDGKYKVIYTSLKLASEAGEVAGKVGKALRDAYGEINKDEVGDEIGDVLWYCAALATDLGSSLEEIAQRNLDKLASRKERNVLSGSGDTR